MGRRKDIEKQVSHFIRGNFKIVQSRTIPSSKDLGFGKDGRTIKPAILYADIRRSSEVTERHRRQTTAKIYKSFLYAMANIARHNGGQIRSFDGDRIMVVFPPDKSGENQACIKAVSTGKEMAWFFEKILKPKLNQYDNALDCGIGIAFGEMLVVRVGLPRNSDHNDIVLVGRAANLAAKLSDRGRKPHRIWIDEETYNRLKKGSAKHTQWKSRNIKFAGKTRKAYATKFTQRFS